jgi:4-amino-4-deoxy-L-arabinose transferase-like glycosyltransferase
MSNFNFATISSHGKSLFNFILKRVQQYLLKVLCNLKKIKLSDYLRFILLVIILTLAFVIRIYNIDMPLVDNQYFRQNYDAGYAKNYYLGDMNPFLPHIVYRGDDYNEVNEFPFHAYLSACIYCFKGINVLWGRYLSVVCSVLSILMMYLLVKKHSSIRIALITILLLSISPIYVYYGRCFIRHPMVVLSMITTLYIFSLWTDDDKNYIYMMGICFFGALAGMMNPPALLIGLPMVYLSWKKYNYKFVLNLKLWIQVFLIIGATYLWIKHAYKLSDFHNMEEKGSLRNWSDPNYYLLWLNMDFFYAVFDTLRTIMLSPIGFIFFVIGIFVNKNKGEGLFLVWMIATFLYFALDPYPIYIAPHTYYFLQLTPIMAFFAAKGIDLFLLPRETND